MTVGVKYCGGCNPRFDRPQLLNRLKAACENICFEYVRVGKDYEHLLVICGCPSKCADISGLNVTGETVWTADENDLEFLATKLMEWSEKG